MMIFRLLNFTIKNRSDFNKAMRNNSGLFESRSSRDEFPELGEKALRDF